MKDEAGRPMIFGTKGMAAYAQARRASHDLLACMAASPRNPACLCRLWRTTVG